MIEKFRNNVSAEQWTPRAQDDIHIKVIKSSFGIYEDMANYVRGCAKEELGVMKGRRP